MVYYYLILIIAQFIIYTYIFRKCYIILKNKNNIINDKTIKLVKLTEENYFLKKKCNFIENQLYINNKENNTNYDIDNILEEISIFGMDNLDPRKIKFLKNYNKNKE